MPVWHERIAYCTIRSDDKSNEAGRRGGGVEEIAGLVDFRSRESSHLRADCIMRDAENTRCAKENYNMQPPLSHRGLLLAAPVKEVEMSTRGILFDGTPPLVRGEIRVFLEFFFFPPIFSKIKPDLRFPY